MLATQTPAHELEHTLGDPFNPEAAISFRKLVEYDEREESPVEAFEILRGWGIHAQLVPQTWGGRLTSFEELLALVRVLSRRDLVLTTALGSTMLAAIPVWAWGTDDQRRELAHLLLSDGAFGCFAVSERDAGSDFQATMTRADEVNGGYVIRGEKWLIGKPPARPSWSRSYGRSLPCPYCLSGWTRCRRRLCAGCPGSIRWG